MKVLIVGMGSMGKRRARLLKGMMPDVQLFGVDASLQRCEEAQALGICMFSDLHAALAQENYDAALVCTAPLTHAGIIDVLLDADLNVFTELNLVSDGYEALMKKAADKNLVLFLSSTMLYRAETQYIKQQVQAFDKPVNYLYHIGQYLPDWHPWESYKNFLCRAIGAPAACAKFSALTCLGWWIRSARWSGFMWKRTPSARLEIDYPDSCFVTLRHKNGVKGVLAVDVVSPKAVRNFEVYGEGLHLFWEGNPKALCIATTRSKSKRLRWIPTRRLSTMSAIPIISWKTPMWMSCKTFWTCWRGKAQPRWSFEKDLGVIALMEKIEEA